jgi:hypothetical protein
MGSGQRRRLLEGPDRRIEPREIRQYLLVRNHHDLGVGENLGHQWPQDRVVKHPDTKILHGEDLVTHAKSVGLLLREEESQGALEVWL